MQLPGSTVARLGIGLPTPQTNNSVGRGQGGGGGGLVPNLGVFKNHQFVAVGHDHTTCHLPLGEPLLRVRQGLVLLVAF